MSQTQELLAGITDSPYTRLKQTKQKTGQKVVGCFPMYVPEEIVHAAGLLPVVLLGQDQPITLADNYLQPSTCEPVRSDFDLSLKGGLDCLDGLVFPDICEPIQMISEVWNIHQSTPFFYHLMVPNCTSAPYSLDQLTKEFSRMKTSLEKLTGKTITQSDLRKSIALYNENRRLLHRLYDLRRKQPEQFKARDIATVVASSMLMPKEEHNKLLKKLLDEVSTSAPGKSQKARLVISGYFCDTPETDILDLVEELGAVVVDDDLYVGRRYFHTLVDEKGDPLDSLARRYIEDVPCPTKFYPGKEWADYLLKLCKEAKADGLLVMMLKFCEPHSLDYRRIKQLLSKEDSLPHLMIETDHSGATGQIRTRLQAFIEMVQG